MTADGLTFVDTNVLVSALLKPQGPPGQVLNLVLAGRVGLVVDNRILAEYRESRSRNVL